VLSSTISGTLSSDFRLETGDLLRLPEREELLCGLREPLRDLRKLDELEDEEELELRDRHDADPEFRELDPEFRELDLPFKLDDVDDVDVERCRRRSLRCRGASLLRKKD